MPEKSQISDFFENFKLENNSKIKIGREFQKNLISSFLSEKKSKLFFLSGPPGTAKTSLSMQLSEEFGDFGVKRINCLATNSSNERIFYEILKLFENEKIIFSKKNYFKIFCEKIEKISGKIILIFDEIDAILNYENLEIIENLQEILQKRENTFIFCICNKLDLAELILGEPLASPILASQDSSQIGLASSNELTSHSSPIELASYNGLASFYENNTIAIKFPAYSSSDLAEIVKSKLNSSLKINESGLKMIINLAKNDLRHVFEIAQKSLLNLEKDEELFKPNRISESKTIETREKAALNLTQDQKAILLAVLKLSSAKNWEAISQKEIFFALEEVVGFTKIRGERIDMLQNLCERGFLGILKEKGKKKTVSAAHTFNSKYNLLINSEIVKSFSKEARLSKIL